MPDKRKHQRSKKSQLGQFFTPSELAEEMVQDLTFKKHHKVLEPGCGDGSFVMPLIEQFQNLYQGSLQERATQALENNIYAIELDPNIYLDLIIKIEDIYDLDLKEVNHNIRQGDYLLQGFGVQFDYIIGNPPFGGTITYEYQDKLDKEYGRRHGYKIKKETYSFFMVKSLDSLKENGTIRFICSDTFLTIKTMSGLRRILMAEGKSNIRRLNVFSEETDYPMVVFDFSKTGPASHIVLDSNKIWAKHMELTGNFSWTIIPSVVRYFDGPKIGDYMVCSSGMTIGKNEWFVREITDNHIMEPYDFEFFDDPIILDRELQRARLNKLGEKKRIEIALQEITGDTRRNIRIIPKDPVRIELPDDDYRYYNKASNTILYEKPKYAVYWKDDGDAVYTFKKNGNWYLHGVGGKPYFGREGVTWGLISTRIAMRHLPSGFILDSGAPCGFLKEGVDEQELYFILGWCLTDLATGLLKKYINHTKNIQGKDVERLPYPYWVPDERKISAIDMVLALIDLARSSEVDFGHPGVKRLNDMYRKD